MATQRRLRRDPREAGGALHARRSRSDRSGHPDVQRWRSRRRPPPSGAAAAPAPRSPRLPPEPLAAIRRVTAGSASPGPSLGALAEQLRRARWTPSAGPPARGTRSRRSRRRGPLALAPFTARRHRRRAALAGALSSTPRLAHLVSRRRRLGPPSRLVASCPPPGEHGRADRLARSTGSSRLHRSRRRDRRRAFEFGAGAVILGDARDRRQARSSSPTPSSTAGVRARRARASSARAR